MQVIRTDEQIARDDKERAILLASQSISQVQAKEIHTRHKQYAKRAKNLAGMNKPGVKSAIEYERLLLLQRLEEIDKYLGEL